LPCATPGDEAEPQNPLATGMDKRRPRSWPSSKFLGYQVLTHRCVLSLCVAVAGGGGVGECCFWAHYNISILTYLLTYLLTYQQAERRAVRQEQKKVV